MNSNTPLRPNGPRFTVVPPQRPGNGAFALQKTGIKTITKRYSQVVAIMAEFGKGEQILKKALLAGHGINIDELTATTPDPMLHFVVSEIQMKNLKEHDIPNPTFMQILGTCEVIGISEPDAIARFRVLYKG